MPVIDVSQNLNTFTLTFVAEFNAPIQRIWDIYADPRQLERIWGPPSYPATFVDHKLSVGGHMTYFMTSPEGDKYCGYWQVTYVEEPKQFIFYDGFADTNFNPIPNMPLSKNTYSFEETENGTRVTYSSTFASREGLEKVIEMGVIEGATAAINQIDQFVAE